MGFIAKALKSLPLADFKSQKWETTIEKTKVLSAKQ